MTPVAAGCAWTQNQSRGQGQHRGWGHLGQRVQRLWEQAQAAGAGAADRVRDSGAQSHAQGTGELEKLEGEGILATVPSSLSGQTRDKACILEVTLWQAATLPPASLSQGTRASWPHARPGLCVPPTPQGRLR